MPKVKYTEWSPRPEGRNLVEAMNTILAEYGGMVLTARQLYYQFVSRDLLPASWKDKTTGSTNNTSSYKKLTDLLSQARLAGLVDWDKIEDRGRVPMKPADWRSIVDIADVAVRQFRLPRWDGQTYYVEMWVEKQALAGVLEPLARELHVTLMVNKGYSSQSAMRESALRFSHRCAEMSRHVSDDVRPLLIYLGDHDPSGKDMRRDIAERMAMFGVENLKVDMIALTTKQVKEHKPPPNPAKVSDPRAKAYIEEFGDDSWELDALPPRALQDLVRNAIERRRDNTVYEAVLAEERRQQALMRTAVHGLNVSTKAPPAAVAKTIHECAHDGCDAGEDELMYCAECDAYFCEEHGADLVGTPGHDTPEWHWNNEDDD